jgi:uncharacterized membrane protein YoaT (DUF817 family)
MVFRYADVYRASYRRRIMELAFSVFLITFMVSIKEQSFAMALKDSLMVCLLLAGVIYAVLYVAYVYNCDYRDIATTPGLRVVVNQGTYYHFQLPDKDHSVSILFLSISSKCIRIRYPLSLIYTCSVFPCESRLDEESSQVRQTSSTHPDPNLGE